MLRRQFIAWMSAPFVVAALSPLEALAPSSLGPVLALEASTPYWLLELQAYQRLYNAAWSARMDGTLEPTPRGSLWSATFPTHPEIGES